MKRSRLVILGVVGVIASCTALSCVVFMLSPYVPGAADEVFDVVSETSQNLTLEERDALEQKANAVCDTLVDRDFEAFMALWRDDGFDVSEQDAREVYDFLAPPGARVTGYRLQDSFVIISSDGDRDLKTMLIIDRDDGTGSMVLFMVHEDEGVYRLYGFPMLSEY